MLGDVASEGGIEARVVINLMKRRASTTCHPRRSEARMELAMAGEQRERNAPMAMFPWAEIRARMT